MTYEELMSGHSKIRNKGIANIFSQMGLVEAGGSGIQRILNAASEYGLPVPNVQVFDNMFRVELYRLKQMPDQTIQETNQAIQETDQAIQGMEELLCSEEEQEILMLIQKQPRITQQEMAEVLGWTLARVKYYTMKLKEKHVLDREGSSQKGQWKILKAYKPRG